jgi:hypothetical protein
MAKDEPAPEGKSKEKIPASTMKRPTRKKPKDKPKRPLSAYNFFFKEEREKILKILLAEDPKDVENDPGSEDYIGEEMMKRLKKEGGKVSFEEMGKLIGQRWKNIDPDRLSKYSELAAEDTERYKKEMQSYNGRQEAKMRSEALKPPAWTGGKSDAASSGFGKGTSGEGGRPIPGAYSDPMSSSFANQAAAAMGAGSAYGNPYAGIDFGGAYSMGGMYPGAAYGGYGMGMAPEAMGSSGAAAAFGRQAGGPGMYASQMMMGGAGGFQQGMLGGYGGQMDMYGAPPYGLPDQMGYPQQGYGADGWGGQ